MPKTPRFSPSSISRAARSSARVIEVLAYPSVQLLDVTGPLQVFATANEQILEAGGTPPYAFRVVAKDRARVTASSGLEIATESLPRAGSELDTLVVAGGPGVDLAASDPVLLDWLRQRVKKARGAWRRSAPAHFCSEHRAHSTDGVR
jgi:transcriptional regulator GlxA family with amidase domain